MYVRDKRYRGKRIQVYRHVSNIPIDVIANRGELSLLEAACFHFYEERGFTYDMTAECLNMEHRQNVGSELTRARRKRGRR